MNADREITDPALDALLREHSAETPPRDVDSAILAAAHRAVGSRPRKNERASATPSWRWWMPLAAAAVISVVVIGVLPLAPTIVDDAAPPVVSDSPPLLPRSGAGAPDETASRHKSAASPQSPSPARTQLPDAAAAPSDATRKDGEPPRARAKRDAADLAARVPSKMEGSRMPAPNPFPLEANRSAAPDTIPMQKRQSASEAAALSPVAPSAKSSVAAAGSIAAEDTADAEGRRAAEWIRRIRALRNEGKLAEATQELTRFRAAFGDADTWLPEDLRSWADAIPR